ncbi:MAG TPA: nitroreductase family protein [Caldithrix abyssi]|uniref:Nitroreductase family protein n=1 Tax=Caldithrix abyssi TaxID=187145 RepID=A0A7V5LJC6_CALAY|nr:nitroreductase family protein [Caldithrix abyssi]
MEALEAIYTRRSIRQFTDQPVEAEKIESLLRAAMQAPSAHNKQPWHFLIINDRSLLNQIADFHPYAKMLYKAPLALAVCGDLGKESNDRYLALNCAAATQNILLTAHGLNLGAVWIAVYPREERIKKIKLLLELPLHIIPISLVAVGYPAQKVAREDRHDPKKVHVSRW